MSVAKLLSELARNGIRLKVEGGRLRYAPRSAKTPELIARLKAHRAELLVALRAEASGHGMDRQDAADASHVAPDRIDDDRPAEPAGAPAEASDGPRAAEDPLSTDEPPREPADDSEAEASDVEPRDAADLWQAALDRLEGDPSFLPPDAPPDAMGALRAASVRWADDGPRGEPADDSDASAPTDDERTHTAAEDSEPVALPWNAPPIHTRHRG